MKRRVEHKLKCSFWNSIQENIAFGKLQLGPRLKMGGDKTGRGKKIPREERTTTSTRSAQTPFGVQEEGVSGRKGGVDGGMRGG